MPIRNGKTVAWAHTLKIKHLLVGGDSPQNARKVAREIAAVVDKASFMANWRRRDALNSIGSCDELDGVLANLYDFCDAKLVWVE